jgi:uncharacterized membrane protein
MRSLHTSLALLAMATILGCGETTKPGGPGATKPKENKTVGEKTGVTTTENTFELKLPGSTSINQGETKVVTVSINRGKNFDQDVKLDFAGVPTGVKVTPANPSLKASEKSVDVTIAAAADAALGEHTIKVAGAPGTGSATSGELKITVKKP